MKKLTMAWTLGLGCALALGAAADEKTTKAPQTGGGTMTVTGCLEKGDDPNPYELTHVASGTDWGLVDAPATSKMSDHVGHKVEVSGTALAAGEKTADEKGISSGTGSGTAKMRDKRQERRIKVTSMKHVAATCP